MLRLKRHACLVFGLINQFVFTDPRHHATQLCAHDFNGVLGIQTTTGCHFGVIGFAFQNKAFGVGAILNVFQALFHRCAGLGVNDLLACDIFTVFGIVRNAVIHVGDTAFVHQIYNQLQFVQAFKVSHFRRIACFG